MLRKKIFTTLYLIASFTATKAVAMNPPQQASAHEIYWMLKQMELPIDLGRYIIMVEVDAEVLILTKKLESSFEKNDPKFITKIIDEFAQESASPFTPYAILRVFKIHNQTILMKINGWNDTLLHAACYQGYTICTKLLLHAAQAHGIAHQLLLATTNIGWTALHTACSSCTKCINPNCCHIECANLLLNAAQACEILEQLLLAKTKVDDTAQDLAEQHNRHSLLKLLKKFTLD